MIRMTKADALAIQRRHVDDFVEMYGEYVRDAVARATSADLLADGEHDVVEINRHIPRGVALEHIIPHKRFHEAALKAWSRDDAKPLLDAIDDAVATGLVPIERIRDAAIYATGQMLGRNDDAGDLVAFAARRRIRDIMASMRRQDLASLG